jgi:hypothetical protein
MSKLKDEMPDSELQRYCDIVINASAEARKEFRLFELKPIIRLLTDHLPDFPLAEGAIREYVLAILRLPVKVGGRYDEPDEKVVDCFVAVVEVLGEEPLPLLPPLLNSFSPDIPWLIKLLTKVKDSDVWTSPTFLPQLCTTVLDPAIDQLKRVTRPGNRPAHSYPPPKPILPVRESNNGDCTVTKEELKLFI